MENISLLGQRQEISRAREGWVRDQQTLPGVPGEGEGARVRQSLAPSSPVHRTSGGRQALRPKKYWERMENTESQAPEKREPRNWAGNTSSVFELRRRRRSGGTRSPLHPSPSPALASAPAPPPQARKRRTPPSLGGAKRALGPPPPPSAAPLSRQKVSSGEGTRGRNSAQRRQKLKEDPRSSREKEPLQAEQVQPAGPRAPLGPLARGWGGGWWGPPGLRGQSGEGGHAAGLPPGAAGQRPGPGAQRRRFMQPGRLGSGGGGGGGWNHVRAALGAAAAASREPRWPGGPHLLRLRLRLHLSPRRRHPAPWLRGRRRGSCCLCAPCPCPSPTCATASWAARGPCSSPWHCRSRWALPLSPRRACRHPLCRLPPCASAPPRSRPRRRRTTRVSGSRPSPRSSPPPPEPTAGGWRAAAAAAAAAPGTPGSGPRRPPARWSRRRASYWRGKRRSPAPRTKSSQAGGQPTGAASGVAPPAPRNTGRKSCHRRWSSVSRKGGPARCWRRSAYTRTCGRWA